MAHIDGMRNLPQMHDRITMMEKRVGIVNDAEATISALTYRLRMLTLLAILS